MTAIAVALVAANAASYAVEDGKQWTHLGEVSSVTDNRLVMTQSQDQENSFTLTADVKVTLDDQTIEAADLKPGTKIRVTTTKDDQKVVSRIEAIDKHPDFADSLRDGNLVSITDNQLVMTSVQGREHSHMLAADAVLILDGKACEAADLKPGMKIRATTEGADQSVVNRVEAFDKTAHSPKTANVEKNRQDGSELSRDTDKQMAQPRTNDRMATEGADQNVTDRSDAIDQRSDAAKTRHDGKVVSFTDNRLVMTDPQGQEHSHTLMDNAKLTLDGKACEAADLKPGTKIRVTTRAANRIEGIDKNPDFASSIREDEIFHGTDKQWEQPRTNDHRATEGEDQNVTDRNDAIDQRSDAAKTQQDARERFRGTDNLLEQPRTDDRRATEGADQNVTDRNDAIDQRSDAARTQQDASERFRGTDNLLEQPQTNDRRATEGADQNVTDRSDAIDQRSDAAKTQHDGKVVRFTDDRLVMTDLQGQEHSHMLMDNAKLTLDGEACEPADLKPGTRIRVTTRAANRIEGIDKNPDFASSIDRSDAIDQKSDAAKTHHDGKLVSITGDRLVMTGAQGQEHSHTLMDSAKLTLDGKACEPADLKPGMKIRVTTEGDDQSVANRIEALDKNVDFASL